VKKRVLQFIGSFHQGGTERQAVSLTRSLLDDGTFDVYAATLNKDGILLDEIESLGLPEIPEYRLTSFFSANFVRQVRRCARYLKENQIDLVHTHDFYTNVFGMAAAALAGVEARVASKRETDGMRSSSQEFVEKLAFGRAKAIVVNASAVRQHLFERSISADKIHVIYNGLDIDRFSLNDDRASICRELGLPEGRRYITLVANLRHPVKNVPMFLRTAKLVADVVPDAHFIVAGEGELESELKSLASELGVAERAHFIGRCTDVPALLSASYACVLTSIAEGLSNSILEYMAAGKPVVATNVGGAAEAVFEGETGYLVTSDDDAAMSARLIELLQDEVRSARFGAAGARRAAAKFSIDARLQSTIGLYNEVFGSNPR
jgi:glycosyltransferase involved in cell wall biosynthesis